MSEVPPKEDFNSYIGREVGPYHLHQLIGAGGMGAVFLATHSVLHKKVALKLLREQHRQDKETARSFFEEAKNAAATGHENIIEVFDVDEDKTFGPFMVMEYLANAHSLAEVIRKQGQLPYSRIQKITLQVASALAATHARGVVHCDLKPSNILLIRLHGQDDVVKLIDFGIAKTIHTSAQPTQGPKIVRGTPKYMSPEQVAGKHLDGRSDQYSLGILVYLMLSGVAPFSTGSPADTMRKQYYDPPPPIRDKRPDLPAAAEAALYKALEKKPDARFLEITDFAKTFTDALPREVKPPDKPAPPLLIEEFGSKDQDLFDGPSLIGMQAVPEASPSEATGNLSPYRRTLPRMGVVQPSELPALFDTPPLLRHPEDSSRLLALSGTEPPRSEPPTVLPGPFVASAPKASAPNALSLFEGKEQPPSVLFPTTLPGGTAAPAPLAASPPKPEEPKQDILTLGRSWSSIPIIQAEETKEEPSLDTAAPPAPQPSGPYHLGPLEPGPASEAPQSKKEAPTNPPKIEKLHQPKRYQEPETGRGKLWLSLFLLAGSFSLWCYLSGYFGGFVLPAPASASPQKEPGLSQTTPSTEPASAPTSKPSKKKKKKTP